MFILWAGHRTEGGWQDWRNLPIITLHKTKLQKFKDLNVRPDTLTLIEGKVGNSLEFMGKRKDFQNRVPIA